MAQSVLVTGVRGALGAGLVAVLGATAGITRVVAVDLRTPTGGAELTALLGDPLHPVDTVVHLAGIDDPPGPGTSAPVWSAALAATTDGVLDACRRYAHLHRLVVASSTAVYGSSPADPAMFTEEMTPRRAPTGPGRDSARLERSVTDLRRRRPDLAVAVLRFADRVGAGVQAELAEHLGRPVVTTVLGFDPRLQLLHQDDAREALRLAVVGDVVGPVNVAGDGVLTLHQAAVVLGRPWVAVPAPMVAAVAARLGTARRVPSDDLVRLLTYGRGVDTTRMRRDLGLLPTQTSRSALADQSGRRRSRSAGARMPG